MDTVPQPLDTLLIEGLREVLGAPSGTIALHEPEFNGNEREFLMACLDSTFVSSVGSYIGRFEQMLSQYTGARNVIAVTNGTAALHVALRLAGIGPDDEVLVPALSFVATANAVAYCGAIPHFVDSAPDTLGMDPDSLEKHLKAIAEKTSTGIRNHQTGRRIGAIVPMHTYGHPVNMSRLVEVAGRYTLPIVEDATESLGSTFEGRHTGTFGKLGVLSFNGNKVITTGGGGAVLTDDDELARHARHLVTTAKRPHAWESVHDEIGWNYRLPNLNAALGCAQMERLPDILERKRRLAARYLEVFESLDGLRCVSEPAGARSNYWLNTIVVDRPDLSVRDSLLSAANAAGYQCRPTWALMNTMPMYSDCPRASLDIAEGLESGLINLPSSARLVDAS